MRISLSLTTSDRLKTDLRHQLHPPQPRDLPRDSTQDSSENLKTLLKPSTTSNTLLQLHYQQYERYCHVLQLT